MLDSRLEHNLHIFVNSVEFIAKVIDLAKLTPEQVKVVCSVSGDNGENNQRKLGKDYPIGQPSDPVRKINFYTSTCFEGCDLYDENGVTFIVSDGNKSHTLLDISTLSHRFADACGIPNTRARLSMSIPRPSTAEMLPSMNLLRPPRKPCRKPFNMPTR